MDRLKIAWWRGKKVRDANHSLTWYKNALSTYSEAERKAFLAGYAGQPLE